MEKYGSLPQRGSREAPQPAPLTDKEESAGTQQPLSTRCAGPWPLHFCMEGPFLFQSHIQQGQSCDPRSLLPISLGFFPISQDTDLSCTPEPRKSSRINREHLPHRPLVRSVLQMLQTKSAPHFPAHGETLGSPGSIFRNWGSIQTY